MYSNDTRHALMQFSTISKPKLSNDWEKFHKTDSVTLNLHWLIQEAEQKSNKRSNDVANANSKKLFPEPTIQTLTQHVQNMGLDLNINKRYTMFDLNQMASMAQNQLMMNSLLSPPRISMLLSMDALSVFSKNFCSYSNHQSRTSVAKIIDNTFFNTKGFSNKQSEKNSNKAQAYHGSFSPTKQSCPSISLKNDPETFKVQSSKQFNYQATNKNVSLNCNTKTNLNKNFNSQTQTNWIIDSGATIHMCNHKELLTDYVTKQGHYVTISDGSQISIEGFGSLSFSIIDDHNLQHKFILDGVAFVPKLTVNLISVKELTNLDVTVAFSNGKCKVIHSEGSITIGSLMNGLYIMKITHNKLRSQSIEQSHLCIHDWHRKLSHRNIDHLKRIKDVLQLKVDKCECDDECVDCIKGKISAPPFLKCSEKPNTPRTLITSDLCGQFKTQTLGGAKFFITLIDAATDYTEVVTLKHKSDAATAVKNFMEKCNTQFGRYPQTFRSDRGGEFMSTDVQTFLSEKGITFECTVPNTP